MVNDSLPLNYKIPKIELNVRPSKPQQFTVQYGVYNESTGTTNYWITMNQGNPYIVDLDGTIADLEFTGLDSNTTYIVRFTEYTLRASYDFLFKTGRNISLGDSPYYNKVLFPGQVYDWYLTGLDEIGMPLMEECTALFKLNGNKRLSGPKVQIDQDNFGSLCTYTYQAGLLTPTIDKDAEFKNCTDKDGTSLMALYINNTEANNVFIGSTDFHLNENNRWVGWDAYVATAGGGGIFGSNFIKYNIGFCFCVEESVTSNVTLLYFDSKATRSYPVSNPICKFTLSFNTSGHLVAEGTSDRGNTKLESDFTLEKNKWYFVHNHRGDYLTIYSLDHAYSEEDEVLPSFSTKTFNISNAINAFSHVSTNDATFDINTGKTQVPPTYAIPCVFGDIQTKGVYISNFTIEPFGNLGAGRDFIYKILCPNKYAPKAQLSGTTKNGKSWKYNFSAKLNNVIDKEKISLLIDPDLFEKVDELQGVIPEIAGNVTLDLLSNSNVYSRTTFEGYDYPDPEDYSPVHVGAIVDSGSYTTESYRLNFKEEKDPLKALSSFFFTKHGTWGGYNGGVNGHCIYFNGEGNLVLECHGDYYGSSNSTLKNNHCYGVCKESLVKPYTGYGDNVNYTENTWDQRSNKMSARTGTALVSNKYYQYGRVDVTMKIPVGTWGVCPAIWLFHYIELGDTDYRYDIPPYNERNIQGSSEDGFYRVVNNEIDIELPSHLTNGVLPSWSDLEEAFFDTDILDINLHIGLGKTLNAGLYRLNNLANPNARESWSRVEEEPQWKSRINPSFKNCKFNNWVGELNAGDGWCLPPDSETSAMDYYYGTNEDYAGEKEEYCSMLTPLATNENGYADGQFHKWSIVWLPDKTVLLVDDKVYRVNKGFVPFNQMKLTIAMWFPTMAINKKGEGLIDRDGVNGIPNAVIGSNYDPIRDGKHIGTWAGTEAPFEVCHLEISEIAYEKYNVGDDITIEGVGTTHIDKNPMALGESFPESGLRMFV